jgi:hypothetical protein
MDPESESVAVQASLGGALNFFHHIQPGSAVTDSQPARRDNIP